MKDKQLKKINIEIKNCILEINTNIERYKKTNHIGEMFESIKTIEFYFFELSIYSRALRDLLNEPKE